MTPFTWDDRGGWEECHCCTCLRELGVVGAKPSPSTFPGEGFYISAEVGETLTTFVVGLAVAQIDADEFYLPETLTIPAGWINEDTSEGDTVMLAFTEYYLSDGRSIQLFESEEITVINAEPFISPTLRNADPMTLCLDQFSPFVETVLGP